jgi:hypothetical protein
MYSTLLRYSYRAMFKVSLTLTWTRSMLKLKQERARLSLLDFAAAGHELVLPCALQLRLPGMLVSGK